VQFVARITPSGGEDEPVRSFPFYLLSKSYADIQKEAAVTSPAASMDVFIDTLDVSKQLKAWMKSNHCVNLAGGEFIKKLKVNDVMDVPEFFSAYVQRMAGDRTVAFPTPKYQPEEKDPAKYEKLKKQYLDAVRAFLMQNPDSTDGIDLSLDDVNPGQKWDMLNARSLGEMIGQASDLAQGKYLVARADTDLQGRGSVRGVPPGNYWFVTLNIEAIAGDARKRWDVPVTVRAGQSSYVSLTNSNAVRPAGSAAP
jgi:hypothetical protein